MSRRFNILTALLCVVLCAHAMEYEERIPYGDFEQWAVRYITESKILGGKTKELYAIAPTDTIYTNSAFTYGLHGNPWTVSNAYAKVAGVEKGSNSVYAERRGNGWCARLDCKLDSVVAMRIIDLKVLVAGSIFTGKTHEPVSRKGANDPYSVIELGVPFTRHPSALRLDYKAVIEPSDSIIFAKATSYPRVRRGTDCAEIYVYLQRRWEDTNGRLHASRVGTAYMRVEHSVPQWHNDCTIPIRYGDITIQPGYHDYEGLNEHHFRAMNSRGQMVLIEEDNYSEDAPTHMIIMMTSSRYEAFVGHAGNTLWVDNIRLVYDH